MQNRTKCLLGVVVCSALTWSGWTAFSADPPPPANGGIRAFMRMKLDASTKILEGLTTENFQMIGEGAKTLQSMSAAEKWRVSNDVLYRQYSAEFRHNADQLLEKANARNLDGATLAWVECTMSCVRCHNHARAIRIAGK